jgi:adenine phosphoribosyltransferase
MNELNAQHKEYLLKTIRDVPDFPKKWIVFKDITTLLNNAKAFKMLLDYLVSVFKDKNIDFVAGAESRGFIFGAPLADRLNAGFIPIRKPKKLPFTTISHKYSLEYGTDEVEIHIDAFRDIKDPTVLFVDNLIATGGTAQASIKLLEEAGAKKIYSTFVINLTFLNGLEKIKDLCEIHTVLDI